MEEDAARSLRFGRWTPARLIALGAVMGFGPTLLDAGVTLGADLALLSASLDFPPYTLALLDQALATFLVPVGLFLVLCGVLLSVRSHHPFGRRMVFRVALGGAGLNLAAGLVSGILKLALLLLPAQLATVGLFRDVVVGLFVGAILAAAGLLVCLCGIAAVAREPDPSDATRPTTRLRERLRKSIYRFDPSAR